ncbi:MAG: superoxide dismutase [Stenomitos rutilans HA7619-LM2]|jgi:Fe-Mn family superoxide dismutase|nr:superoxide dismutase [Stenomitos rutilans HA7619-LM2]
MTNLTLEQTASNTAPVYPFPLPALRFAYDALEPFIDAETMQVHHQLHHQTYINNLNAAIKDYPQLHQMSIEDILRQLDQVPESIRATVRNQGGGHANHQFFWKILKPGPATTPEGVLGEAIAQAFESFDNFKTQFHAAGLKLFGSGWVFLVVDPKDGSKLKIHTTANQDSVLLEGLPGLLCCDVWEHAYYLKYHNRRADYLEAFWHVVDWDVVARRLEGFRAGKRQL